MIFFSYINIKFIKMLLTVKTNYSSNGYQGSIRKVFQRDNFEKKSCSRAQIWIIWNAAETAFFRT